MHRRNIFCGFRHVTMGLCESDFSSISLALNEEQEDCRSQESLSDAGSADFQAPLIPLFKPTAEAEAVRWGPFRKLWSSWWVTDVWGAGLSFTFLVAFSQSSFLLSHRHAWAPFPVLKSSCSKLSALFEALNPQVCCSGRWANLLPRGGNRDHRTKIPPSSLPRVFKHFPPSLLTTFI